MNKEELETLEREADALTKSVSWWEQESALAMSQAWELEPEEEDLEKMIELEKRLEYLENKGRFEAAQVKKFDDKLARYFTKRMRECQKRKKTQDE
jgi:hypothetical protein